MCREIRLPLLLTLALAGSACGDSGADRRDASTEVGPDDVADAVDDGARDADGTPDGSPDSDEDAEVADAHGSNAADSEDGDAEDPCRREDAATEELAVGDWTLSVDLRDGSWWLRAPGSGEPSVRGPATCVDESDRTRLAVYTGVPYVLELTGGFRIDLHDARSTAAWRLAQRPTDVVRSGEGAVDIVHPLEGGGELLLRFSPRDAHVDVQLVAPGYDGGRLPLVVAEDDAFFGLGTQVTGMDLRGRTYPLWTQEQGNGKPEDPVAWPLQNYPEAAYAPMGVVHTTSGWSAVVLDDTWYSADLGASRPDRFVLSSHAALPGVTLFVGTPRERLTSITAYTGRIEAPPVWAFSPWNDVFGGPERLWLVADTLRAEGIPSSAIWAEDWLGEVDTPTGPRLSYEWRWSPARYPDLPADIERLHGRGFAFLGYVNPFVPQAAADWPEAVEGGHVVQTRDGAPLVGLDPRFQQSGMLDVTSAAARDWFGERVAIAAALGVDGWMADYAEWSPLAARFASGEDPWHVHNRYPLLWQRANLDAWRAAHRDDPRGPNDFAFFVRSGWASMRGGSAQHASLLWGGDQLTTWDARDGFATVVPIAAHSGLSGMPIFGSDIAGYTAVFNPPSTKELFYRWTALAAFHPLFRTHHGSAVCGNWSFDRDAETIAHYRRWARVHVLLYPLLTDLLSDAIERGWPMVRHPWLVEPQLRAAWTGASGYLSYLGDDILVAPVLTPGATSREVVLPGTGWWPLFGDAPLGDAPLGGERGERVELDAPVTEVVALVRPGTALLLLAEAPDTFYGTQVEGITDLSDVEGRYRLALYPTPEGGVPEQTRAGVRVSGSGWTPPLDWSDASFEGEALAPCVGEERPCRTDAGVRVAGPGTLTVGGAELAISTEPSTALDIAVGGAAWGELAQPTPLSDLSPDAPQTCILPSHD